MADGGMKYYVMNQTILLSAILLSNIVLSGFHAAGELMVTTHLYAY